MVPLSAVLLVMAVAMLCVWVVHCTLTPEPSPVQVSGPELSPVRDSVLELNLVAEPNPDPVSLWAIWALMSRPVACLPFPVWSCVCVY